MGSGCFNRAYEYVFTGDLCAVSHGVRIIWKYLRACTGYLWRLQRDFALPLASLRAYFSIDLVFHRYLFRRLRRALCGHAWRDIIYINI